jgi:pimeloyl-ACP methyl ester carboxylesterase
MGTVERDESLKPLINHARVLRAGAVAAATALMAGLAVSASAAALPGAAAQASTTTVAVPQVPVLHWHACDGGFQCATARVPLDYRHPQGTPLSVAVIRHRATGPGQPLGSLFVNGGGPGEQIQGFVAEYPAIPAVLRERFDLITFDPRGFGFSSPIRCFSSIEAEDKLLAPVEPYPTFPVGTRQTEVFERTYASFGTQCARRAGALLRHDTTADVARDMNLLREAVGARPLDYIGLSYGTGLGAIYANLFPATVGHMVLDGNLNPVTWTRGGTVPSFVREGDGPNAAAQTRAFLSLCGEQPASVCAFSAGSPAATRAKFAVLLRRLLAHPVIIAGQTFGYAAVFTIVPPGDVSSWQPAAAQLQQLWLATGGRAAPTPRPASTNPATGAAGPYEGLEQTLAVLCSDTADPRNVGDYLAAARAGSRYGGFGELAAWEEAPCAYWPAGTEQDRYTGPWDRPTAGTILVIGNTGDPSTPYQSSVAMARDLARARLLTVDGFGHTEFFNPSECASNYEFRYLTTGALPPQGTICRQSAQPF